MTRKCYNYRPQAQPRVTRRHKRSQYNQAMLQSHTTDSTTGHQKIKICKRVWPGNATITNHRLNNGSAEDENKQTSTVKHVLSGHSIGFQDRISLNAGQKYCRMLQESILQYFRPSLSYHLSLWPLFCLFLSDRLIQGYCMTWKIHNHRPQTSP